jgi:hypothetical protein
VTSVPGVVLAILTADCLPVVFAAADGSEVGAAHAGWRGLADGMLEATVAAMQTPPAQLRAWLGPAAGPADYEIGEEVYHAFVGHDPAAEAAFVATRQATGRWTCSRWRGSGCRRRAWTRRRCMAARCRPWPIRTCIRTGATVAPGAWRRWPGSRPDLAAVRARAGAGLRHPGSAGAGAACRAVALPLRGAGAIVRGRHWLVPLLAALARLPKDGDAASGVQRAGRASVGAAFGRWPMVSRLWAHEGYLREQLGAVRFEFDCRPARAASTGRCGGSGRSGCCRCRRAGSAVCAAAKPGGQRYTFLVDVTCPGPEP